MTKLLLAALALVPAVAIAAEEQSWVREAPAELFAGSELPNSSMLEIVVSKEAAAENSLEKTSWIKVEDGFDLVWVGKPLQCPKGQQTYLVRAVFGHGGTGVFSVHQRGSAVSVMHFSLGRSTPAPTKSALLVCLSAEPSDVFVQMSVAE